MRIRVLFALAFLFFFGCESTFNMGGAGSPDYSGFSPSVQRRLRNMDLAGAINTVMSGPTKCGTELVKGASLGLNWEKFKSQSQRVGNNFTGPFGRVEFYNQSEKALPGGPGISANRKTRFLSKKMLNVIPFLALAHRRKGKALRISHTTSGFHSPNSLHYSGNAIDIDPLPDGSTYSVAQEIQRTLASSGKGCGYFVYVETSRKTGRRHIHVSFKGEKNTGCPGFSVQ